MTALKKMLIKRAIKKKLDSVARSVNGFTRDLSREIKKLDKRIPIKISAR